MASRRSTTTVRIYLGDQALLGRVVRFESAKQDRDVTVAQIIHEALKPWYQADMARQEQERGNT